MTNGREQKELIALVADRNMEFALRGLLSRERSLRASVASYDVFVHPEKDPGCFLKGSAELAAMAGIRRSGATSSPKPSQPKHAMGASIAEGEKASVLIVIQTACQKCQPGRLLR
jgi:hypothetical protein